MATSFGSALLEKQWNDLKARMRSIEADPAQFAQMSKSSPQLLQILKEFGYTEEQFAAMCAWEAEEQKKKRPASEPDDMRSAPNKPRKPGSTTTTQPAQPTQPTQPTLGAEASFENYWWGVTLTLNRQAVLNLSIGEAAVTAVATAIAGAATVVPPPAGPVLTASAGVLAGAMALHAAVINAADKGKGVYFVWAWPTLALIYVPLLTAAAAVIMMIPHANP